MKTAKPPECNSTCMLGKPTGITCAEGECDLENGVRTWNEVRPIDTPEGRERIKADRERFALLGDLVASVTRGGCTHIGTRTSRVDAEDGTTTLRCYDCGCTIITNTKVLEALVEGKADAPRR